MLRTLGQHAFDLEHESAITFNQLCEAWARHLLILAPPTGEYGFSDGDDAPRYIGTPITSSASTTPSATRLETPC